jgi:hypothetical protein
MSGPDAATTFSSTRVSDAAPPEPPATAEPPPVLPPPVLPSPAPTPDGDGLQELPDHEAAAPSPGACALKGAFALRLDAEVRWDGTAAFDALPLVLAGRGTVSVMARIELRNSGLKPTVELRACGVAVPDIRSGLGERHGAEFAGETWEHIAARWRSELLLECKRPGCTVKSDQAVVQLGLVTQKPASWPDRRALLDPNAVRDDDGDGMPGISLRMRTFGDRQGSTYTPAPSNSLLSERLSEIMLAMQLQAQLAGVLDTCDQMSGTVDGVVVNTRALSCRVDTGTICTPESLAFVNDNLPVWTVERAAFRARRVAESAGCVEVRSALE